MPHDGSFNRSPYQAQNFGYLPDAVTDSTRKRKRKAKALFGDGEGIICRLLACPDRDLYHVVIPLSWCDLYGTAPEVAREELQTVLGDAPRYVRLASSIEWLVHIHALVALPEGEAATLVGQGEIFCEPVKDDKHLQQLAEYFSRPHLEAAARPKPELLARFSLEELFQKKLEAAEYYLSAKNWAKVRGAKLPRLSWTTNIPRLKPDLPTWKPGRAAFQRPVKVAMWECLFWAVVEPCILLVAIESLHPAGCLPRSRAPPVRRVTQSFTAASGPISQG